MEHRGEDIKGTCLIAGCGYVGTRLAHRLLSAGPVLALVRRGSAAEVLIAQGIADREGARILAEEHRLYTEAVRLILSGNYRIEGRHVVPQAGAAAQSK